MPDLAIDRALAAIRGAIAVTGFHAPEIACELEDSALAILEAARACDAAWGTPGLYEAQQALHAAIRGEP